MSNSGMCTWNRHWKWMQSDWKWIPSKNFRCRLVASRRVLWFRRRIPLLLLAHKTKFRVVNFYSNLRRNKWRICDAFQLKNSILLCLVINSINSINQATVCARSLAYYTHALKNLQYGTRIQFLCCHSPDPASSEVTCFATIHCGKRGREMEVH